MAYPPEIIAKAKALRKFGVGPKLLSRISDIPFPTLRAWDGEARRASVAPDEQAVEQLKALLR